MARERSDLPDCADILAKLGRAGVQEDRLQAALEFAIGSGTEKHRDLLLGPERKRKIRAVDALRTRLAASRKVLEKSGPYFRTVPDSFSATLTVIHPTAVS